MEKEKEIRKGMVNRLKNNQISLPIYLNVINMHWWLRRFISLTPHYPSSCSWDGREEIKLAIVQRKTKLKEKN